MDTASITLLDFAIRVFCAVLFGFVIGLERQLTGNITGIRISILVALGACIFTLFSQLMDAPDPTRIAAQVVTGVGFLCSGIIFKEGLNVKGLNTAATIWCTAAIGVICASGFVSYAALAAVALLSSNLLFRFLADKIQPLMRFEEEETIYKLSITCQQSREFHIRTAIMNSLTKSSRLTLSNLQSADVIGELVEIEATLQLGGKRRDFYIEKMTSNVALAKGVVKVGWELV